MAKYSEFNTPLASPNGSASVDIITGGNLPTEATLGENLFDVQNNILYTWTGGGGWRSKQLINESPIINSSSTTINLPTDGTIYTLILDATDPEGFEIDWNYTSDDIGSKASIIKQTYNAFLVTLLLEESFTATFTVTDGINTRSIDILFTAEKLPISINPILDVVQSSQPLGSVINICFEFSPDGTKLFVASSGTGPEGDESIKEYILSTPWDLSTATSTPNSIDLDAQGFIGVYDMVVNPEGTRLIVSVARVSTYTKSLIQFNLSTGWNLGTATLVDTYGIPNWGSTRGLGQMFVVPDGRQIWMAMYDNFATHSIKRFGLPTPYTLSGISENTNLNLAGSGSQARPEMLTFNYDGTEFAYGRGDGLIQVYDVSSPYIMTGTSPRLREFTPAIIDYPLVITGLPRIKFYENGTRMFAGGGQSIFELTQGNYSVINTSVTANGSQSYVFSGDVTGTNPTINLDVDDVLVLNLVSTNGHPLWIKTTATTGQTNALDFYSNGRDETEIIWKPGTAGTYFYVCEFHGGMQGQIIVG